MENNEIVAEGERLRNEIQVLQERFNKIGKVDWKKENPEVKEIWSTRWILLGKIAKYYALLIQTIK